MNNGVFITHYNAEFKKHVFPIFYNPQTLVYSIFIFLTTGCSIISVLALDELVDANLNIRRLRILFDRILIKNKKIKK